MDLAKGRVGIGGARVRVRVRVFGVLGFFAWDGRGGRRGRCANGFESFVVVVSGSGSGSGSFVNIGDSGGGVEAALEADIVFDFLLCSTPVFEFLGVGVVPAGEPHLRGWPVVFRWWRQNWEQGNRTF